MPIYGVVLVTVQFTSFSTVHPILIVERLTSKVILGNDFILKHHVTVRMWKPENFVVLEDCVKIPITFNYCMKTDPECQSMIQSIEKHTLVSSVSVCTLLEVWIPANTEAFISSYNFAPIECDITYFEPL